MIELKGISKTFNKNSANENQLLNDFNLTRSSKSKKRTRLFSRRFPSPQEKMIQRLKS